MLAVTVALIAGTLVTDAIAERSRAAAPVWASFLAHVVISLVIFVVRGLWSPDAITYDALAQGYVRYWNHDLVSPPGFVAGKEGWIVILAAVYFAIGHVPLVGLIINASVCAGTTSLLMGATSRVGRPDRAKIAGWLTLLPPFLIWGSLLLRESLAWALIAAGLWASAGIVAKVGSSNVVILVAAFAGMMWIRGSLAVVLIMAFALGIILTLKRVPVVMLGAMVGLTAVGGPLLARAQVLTGAVSIENINLSRGELSASGSGFGTTAYADPLSVVRSLPVMFARALLGPFPWELPSLPVLALVDVAAWFFLLILAWRGWKAKPRSALKVCVVPALCLLAVLGVTSGNYGTMVRLRVEAAILLIPMTAIGWPRKSSAEQEQSDGHRSDSYVSATWATSERALAMVLSERRGPEASG